MQNATELSLEQKENFANELLIYMKNELEKKGSTIKTCSFDFHLTRIEKYFGDVQDETIPEGEDLTNFKRINKITDDEFATVIRYCMTHEFIKRFCCGHEEFDSLQLTDEGFARAVSVERAKYKPAVTDNTTSIHIGSINGDNIQVGNYNTQSICNTFSYLIDEIKNSDASEEEKKTALTKLKDFLSNPIVSGITSGCAVEIIKSLTGSGI